MKILHTSDWHADAVTKGVRRLEEIEAAAWQTARAAKEEGCQHYLFTGDLCDPDKNMNVYDAVRVAQDIALWLSKEDIESHWIAGNHDVIEDGSGMTTLRPIQSLRGIVHVYEKPAMVPLSDNAKFSNELGTWLIALPFVSHALPYDPEKFIRSLTVPKKAMIVVAGHLNIAGVIPGEETHEMPRGRDVYFPVKAVKDIPNPKLLVNGHYHARMKTDHGIHVPGTIARLSFGEETNAPGYLVYELMGDSVMVKERRIDGAWEMRTVDMAKTKRDAIPKGGRRFVRLKPAEGSTDADVLKEKLFWEGNAAAVKVMPRPQSKVILNDEKRAPQKKLTLREAVLAMAAEANSADKERLGEVVEETLALVGE